MDEYNALCPCGSQGSYQSCCAPYITYRSKAEKPEALMRSRYTAYTQANIEYIKKTMIGRALDDFDANSASRWAQRIHWLKLEVIDAPQVADSDTVGFVEFIAHYIDGDKMCAMHERSEFHKQGDQWFYASGMGHTDSTVKTVGRNELCPCESGKKFKKCHSK